MTVAARMIVLLGLVFGVGCAKEELSLHETSSPALTPASSHPCTASEPNEIPVPVLRVDRCLMEWEDLMLDYCVTNVAPHDIWVCVTINDFAREGTLGSVETEVVEGTLSIRRRGCMDQGSLLIHHGGIHAMYRRLGSGESRSAAVILPLPVPESSPVQWMEFPTRVVTLDHVTLEVGYFDEDLSVLLAGSRGGRVEHSSGDPNASGPPDVAYISYLTPNRWSKGLALERSMRADISDVQVMVMVPPEKSPIKPEDSN